MPRRAARTALVLSAGGVRGAYQVGVIAGLIDVLGRRPAEAPLFDMYTASSIGAINAAYLAANADRGDHGIDALVQFWTEIDFDEILQITPLALWGWPRLRLPGLHEPGRRSPYIGRSMFDPRPVEDLLERVIAWDRLHANIRAGLVRGLMLAALDVCDGTTTLFTELAAGVPFKPYPYLTDRALFTSIGAEHVLAATAMPFVFPARTIAGRYYMDGALRFEAPIIPALRAGAERIITISLLPDSSGPNSTGGEAYGELVYPGVSFLIGQLLSAALLDPLRHDINELRRKNRLMKILAATLDPPAMRDVIANLECEVPPGRPIPMLVFQPSENIQALTFEFIRDELLRGRPVRRALLRKLTSYATGQALVGSFLFFDGRLAARLIELGRRDACAQRDRILAFFDA
jgi:NTE family protein